MKLPRVRITVRRLMIAVAAVAVSLGAILSVAEMRTRSAAHIRRAHEFEWSTMRHGSIVRTPDGRMVDRYEDENDRISDAWARRMAEKYRRLSYYPWLAVGPDQPRPVPLAHPRSAFELPGTIEMPMGDGMAYYEPPPSPPPWTFFWTWPRRE